MDQFLRTRLLLGEERFKRLQAARVVVIGLGAVGGYATEALVRFGVKNLRLVDFDVVKPTNLNRQLLALHSTVGRKKAAVARERVLDINPHCVVEVLDTFAADETFDAILGDRPDLVVDAIDAFTPKAQLLTYCYRNRIPVVSSLGAALRTDPSAVRSGDMMKSHGCPLGYRLRRVLRRNGVGKGIICVYSTEPARGGVFEPEGFAEGDEFKRGRTRRVLGSLPTMTGIFGLTVAHAAVDILIGGYGN